VITTVYAELSKSVVKHVFMSETIIPADLLTGANTTTVNYNNISDWSPH